jgi:ribosomal protein S18 acetylase RimI-like enzyme
MQREGTGWIPNPITSAAGSQTVERDRSAVCILGGVEIDSANESDLPALLPLLRSYCDFYGASPSDDGLAAMVKALVAAQDADGMLLVARQGDGVPIGFATVGWKWSSLRAARLAVMEDLFVSPEARGQGAADALIRACAERAGEHGAPVLIWETALDNHRAQAVYERVGATGGPWLEYELELG